MCRAEHPQPVNKLAVNLLLLVSDVDEHKDIAELLTLKDIGAYHLVELVLHGLGAFGIAVSGEVDEIPFVVDDEMVDEQRLTGSGGSLCQAFVVAKHVDETRLADIASSDEGKLRLVVFGAHRHGGCRDDKLGFLDVHS